MRHMKGTNFDPWIENAGKTGCQETADDENDFRSNYIVVHDVIITIGLKVFEEISIVLSKAPVQAFPNYDVPFTKVRMLVIRVKGQFLNKL